MIFLCKATPTCSPTSWRRPRAARHCSTAVSYTHLFHLAALIAIPFSYHSPDSYVDTNIKGTLNVLNAARELDTQREMCIRDRYPAWQGRGPGVPGPYSA